METIGYEFDSLSELPPLPQEYVPMECYRNYSSIITPPPLESLAPFPPSDFIPSGHFTFSDHKDIFHFQQLQQQQQQLGSDSFFLDSSLSLSRADSYFLDSSLSLSLSPADSLFLDSSLSLLNRHHLTESTRFEQLLNENNVATQFLHLPDLNNVATTTQFLHLPDLNDVATTTTPFLHLPELKSFEPTTTTTAMEETTMKRKPFLSLSLPLPVGKRRKCCSSTTSGSPTASSSHTIDGNVSKQKKISDKIRSLEKLMPWEGKMNLANILEETNRYVRFLQSQIASLLWMPLGSVYNTAGEVGETNLLKSLTRQQILQVLANSPGSRNVLSKRGVCVFSHEQILSLKTMSRNL